MDDLYKLIRQILKDDCPEIKWVDQDEGQLDDYPETEQPLTYPAALINVEEDISYRDIAGGKQIATVEFYVKLAFKVYEGSHSTVPNDNYFNHYQVVKKVTALIAGKVKNCRRVKTSKKKKIDPMLHTLRFKTSYLDINT